MSGIELESSNYSVTESPSHREARNQSPIVIKRGRLTLTPITADSSWYRGVAAVTAETMPRAFWQPAGDLQDSLLATSAAIPIRQAVAVSSSNIQQSRSRSVEKRIKKVKEQSRTRKSSESSSSSSEESVKKAKKKKKKSASKKRKSRRSKSSSSSTSTDSSSSSEKDVKSRQKRKKAAAALIEKQEIKVVENPSYYTKYPRSGHSLSVVSPDTTGAYNGAGGTREMSATISGNSGGLPANEMKNLPKPVHVTKTKCPYCVGKQIDVKDIEAHMFAEHNHARFGCCLCNSQYDNDDDDVLGSSDDEDGGLVRLDGEKPSGKFDTYLETREHLKTVHHIQAAAAESEGGNSDVADQLISVPFTIYLRTYSCTLCSAQFIGISEETLRVHFKKAHKTPMFLPQFLKRCCRICGMEEGKSDAELIKHINSAHPRSRFWRDEKSENEPVPQPVLNNSIAESGEILGESESSISAALESRQKEESIRKAMMRKTLQENSMAKKKAEEPVFVAAKKIATVDVAKKSKKSKSDSSNSDSESSDTSESSSSLESKKKAKKRKKSAKKAKKKLKKKSKPVESSEPSSDESDVVKIDHVKVSDKNLINFRINKPIVPEVVRRSPSLEGFDDDEAKNVRPQVNKKMSESPDQKSMVRARSVRKSKERSPSVRSRRSRSRSRSHYRRSESMEERSRLPRYRRSVDSESEYDRRSRVERQRRPEESDSDRDWKRKSRSENEPTTTSTDTIGGFCDDCNLPLPAGRVREHFHSSMHHMKTRGKMRCYLCNKPMQNARQHLEMVHQEDIFRCNVKHCPCPKFVEARKVLDHLERNHGSITQGKTTEQLVRGNFLTLPKNLEVHACSYCNVAFAGQAMDRIYTHMQDRCGVRHPGPNDVIFSCRFCGPRRQFDTLVQLQKHCQLHLDSVREGKLNANPVARGRSYSPPDRYRRESGGRPGGGGYRSRSRERRSRSGSSRSYSRSPDRNRRTSRGRSSSSDRSDASPQKFNCFYCPFSSDSKPNREHHILQQHSNMLFKCTACDSNEPFKAVNRFDVYEHLSTMHGKASEVDEEELDKLMYRPHDLRKIVCLECGDYKALENAQWLCREPHLVSGELKDHLLTSHKGVKVVSRSFGLRCSACIEEFEYDNVDEWSEHVRKFHERNPISRPRPPASPIVSRPAAKRCIYCSNKMDSPEHVLAEHADVTFRCKKCPMDDEKNCYPDMTEIRRHCAQEHDIRDIASQLSKYVIVPRNLVCMKCKYCCEHLYAQTEADLENHFRSEHKSVKNFSKHLDFLCRICMQCETHDTWNDLKQHLEDVHRDLFVTSDDNDTRKEDKELSPDSTGPKVRYTPSRIGRLSVCSLCNMNISGNSTLPSSSLATLRLHLESNHAPETGFICKVCSVPNSAQYHVFIDLAAALEHLQVRHGQVDFSDRSVLKKMFDFPDDPRSFKCLKCSQVFLGQDFHTGGILKHLKNAHGSDPQCLKPMGPRGEDRRLADLKIVVLNCRKCGGNFNSEETLIEHAFSCMTEIW